MKTNKISQKMTKRLIYWAVSVIILLLIPLVLTLTNSQATINGGVGGGWDWTASDFIFGFVVLFGASLIYELVSKRINNKTYKLAVGLSVITSLLLVWINAAVGIIGDPEDGTAMIPNLMYLGILALGFFGAITVRFKSNGMMRVLLAMAIAQLFIPVIALVMTPEVMIKTPGVVGIFILNAFFVVMFLGSALLFKRAI